MKNPIALLFPLTSILLIAGLAGAQKPATDAAEALREKIYEIDQVELSRLGNNPGTLKIEAKGKAATSGWTNPVLTPCPQAGSPADGIYDYDFIATKPSGFVSQVLTPISAQTILDHIPEGMKGVRVHASSNSKVAMWKPGKK